MSQLVKDLLHGAREKRVRRNAVSQTVQGYDGRPAAYLRYAEDKIQVTDIAVSVGYAKHRSRIRARDAFEEQVGSELPPAGVVRAMWRLDRLPGFCFDAVRPKLLDDLRQRSRVDGLNGQEHDCTNGQSVRRCSAAHRVVFP